MRVLEFRPNRLPYRVSRAGQLGFIDSGAAVRIDTIRNQPDFEIGTRCIFQNRTGTAAIRRIATDYDTQTVIVCSRWRRNRRLAFVSLVLAVGFARPLYDLVQFAMHSELFSHVLLIPVVSLYLAWTQKVSSVPVAVARLFITTS